MSRKTRRNASRNAAKRLGATVNGPAFARVGIRGIAVGAIAFSGPLFAADPAPADTNDNNSLQEVVVTGIRASLQKSLDIKEQAVGVVDAISAEDIGQFPDANLGEAIQRIPGISVSRGTSSMNSSVPTTTGDATEITVRGFGPTFNETLFDGRQAASATKDRGFDFSSVGSNFVGEVDVLKTPDATLSSGAIGATIDIKFPKPFDSPGLKLVATGSASDSLHDGQVTPNGGLLFSNTFADDTFGVLAFADYSKHVTQTNHVDAQGWEGFDIAPAQLAPGQSATNPASWFIQDYGIYKEYTQDERKDGRLVVQWHPADSLMVTLDDTFSEDVIKQQQYGYSVWFNGSSLTDVTRAPDGTITSFVQPNTPTDFQGQINGQVIQNNMYGVNLAWDLTSQFKLELDADQSKSRLNPGGQLGVLDADVGYGPSTPTGLYGNNVGIAGIGSNSLPYPTAIGPSGNAAAFINNGLMGSHVLTMYSDRNTDRINQVKLEGTWTAATQTKVKFGLQYSDDDKNLVQWNDFASGDWQAYSGYGPASGNSGGVALPQSFFGGSFSTASFIPGFNNGNSLPANILEFNPYTVLSYLNGLHGVGSNGLASGCCTPPFPGQYTVYVDPSTVRDIHETTYSPFVTLGQSFDIGSMKLKGVLGARYEDTILRSSAPSILPVALTPNATDHTALTITYGPESNVNAENHYRYFLPSLDLNLDITEQWKARFDASRTLTRPPLQDINPVLQITQGQRIGALNGMGGNPNLLPFLSNNFDLGGEWYYGRNEYVAVDAFLKHVTNFVVQGTKEQTVNGVIDPTTGQLAEFAISTEVNGPSAVVRGVELAWQHMLWDTGFGFQANATFVSTNRKYDPYNLSVGEFALPGLANSANFVAFYEKYGFHFRVAVNHRNEYLDQFGQHQPNSLFGSEPVFVNATTQVDLSAQYDITKNVNVFFEGLNLNDATYSTHGRFSDQILDVLDYGPRLTLGVHAKIY